MTQRILDQAIGITAIALALTLIASTVWGAILDASVTMLALASVRFFTERAVTQDHHRNDDY